MGAFKRGKEMKEREIIIGSILIIIGFVLYGITSTIGMKPPFDYYSKPSIGFSMSILIIILGFFAWIMSYLFDKDLERLK